jgi:probable rRNA maturation factor
MTAQSSIAIHAAVGKTHVAYLRRMIAACLGHIRHPPQDISIALVNDATMSDLHQRFMNIPGPTDVLTFELDHDDRTGKVTAGEIVICVPEAKRRCRENGQPIQNELLLYALHGMLHLSGYDDKTTAQYRRMHQAEDRILSRVGVGNVFTSGMTKS